MKIAVVIAYSGDKIREEAFKKVCDFYDKEHPNFKLIVSNSETKIFNLSQAKNFGAKKAIAWGADIVIFNDADVFVESTSLLKSIEVAYSLQEITLPYKIFFQHSSKEQTDLFFKNMNFYEAFGDVFVAPKIMENGLPNRFGPSSGCLIVPKDKLKELGKFNEEVEGWGPEDALFHKAYFDKHKKLFTYIRGVAHSTFNDPGYRTKKPSNKKFEDIVNFK